jgi:hypothetical protein
MRTDNIRIGIDGRLVALTATECNGERHPARLRQCWNVTQLRWFP